MLIENSFDSDLYECYFTDTSDMFSATISSNILDTVFRESASKSAVLLVTSARASATSSPLSAVTFT